MKWDLNPRYLFNTPVFKTGTLNRSVIHPKDFIMSINYKIINYCQELKYRGIYILLAFTLVLCVMYYFLGEFLYYIIKPLSSISTSQIGSLIYTDLSEVFFSSVIMVLYFSLCITVPFIMYQIYYFIIPGTYRYEQKFIFNITLMSLCLFIVSTIVSYNFFIPLIWNFFFNYGFNLNTELFNLNFQGKIYEYIIFITRVFSNLSICFQIPLIFSVLLKTKIISANLLKNNRTWNVILCFILGALLSPPDVFSQICLAFPLCFIYEFSIIFGLYLNRKDLFKYKQKLT